MQEYAYIINNQTSPVDPIVDSRIAVIGDLIKSKIGDIRTYVNEISNYILSGTNTDMEAYI